MANTLRVDRFDFAVIGGGCIGASTVLALQRELPEARIVWFEGTHQQTASKDFNKVIRTPYPDKDYVALAESAMRQWLKDPLFSEYWHQTGWIQCISGDAGKSSIRASEDRQVSSQEMVQMVGSMTEPTVEAAEKLWLNERIGYVDSARALEAVAIEAAKLGVLRKKTDITKLVIDKDGTCRGVESDNRFTIAERTVLAAGAWTPELLKASKVIFPEGFFRVTGVVAVKLRLEKAEFDRLKSMPILVSGTGSSLALMKDLLLIS